MEEAAVSPYGIENIRRFSHLPIDWNLSPEDAVALYLEWGNNNWRAEHPPVRSRDDVAHYFVVDSWEKEPVVRLIQRNSEDAEDLAVFPLPSDLRRDFTKEYCGLKGIYEPTPAIKDWLRSLLYS